MRLSPALLCLLVALPFHAAPAKTPKAPKAPKSKAAGQVKTAKEAKAIAERETGGVAVSARQVPLNGATGGWEVEVRMPKEDQGWRCVVDNDSRQVYTKDRIPNPGSKARKGTKSSRR
jgi:hypothetical protein